MPKDNNKESKVIKAKESKKSVEKQLEKQPEKKVSVYERQLTAEGWNRMVREKLEEKKPEKAKKIK